MYVLVVCLRPVRVGKISDAFEETPPALRRLDRMSGMLIELRAVHVF